jgi:nicotinate-nucleotide adenylyltransferase
LAGVLLFGGSFDPIHHGHLIVACCAAERLAVDRIILIPSARPPHKSAERLAPPADRLAMCRLAVHGDPRFEVSDWEISQNGPSYTLHTVTHFRTALGPNVQLYWLIGLDSLAELATWYRVGELAQACTLVTVGRPAARTPDFSHLTELIAPAQIEELRRNVLDTPLVQIAATEIRARVRAGRGIRYLTPPAVCAYISEHALYAGT